MCKQVPSNCRYEWCDRKAGVIRCTECGNTRVTTAADPSCCRRTCGSPGVPGRWRKRTRLGDLVAAALGSVGITRRRYRATLVYLRLADPQKPCGCAKRQEQLNRIGDGALEWWRAAREKAACRRCMAVRRERNKRWLAELFK